MAFIEILHWYIPSSAKKSLRLAFPCMLSAQHCTNLEDSKSFKRTFTVYEPFLNLVAPGRNLSPSIKLTVLGGFESTIHSHVTQFSSEVHEDSVFISGASVKTKDHRMRHIRCSSNILFMIEKCI